MITKPPALPLNKDHTDAFLMYSPILLNNIRQRLHGLPLEEWIPQTQFLGIIGIGDESALASKAGFCVIGKEMWKLKDRIDRLWMEPYRNLPDMEVLMAEKIAKGDIPTPRHGHNIPEIAKDMGQDVIELLSSSRMRCGGCGSKIGSQILESALRKVQSQYSFTRSEVIQGAGDDAALLSFPQTTPSSSSSSSDSISRRYLMVHTIDYIRTFVSDPFLLGKIAANHALSDIFAMNAEPVSALALCVLPLAIEDMVEDNLVQVLAGIMTILKRERCALVGGHTSEGNDMGVGLAVHGIIEEGQTLMKGPPAVGHVLILTKALGSGVLFMADMKAKAKGKWIDQVVASMLQSNRDAASIFKTYGCSACTDITGFGLMGHLLEMIRFHQSQSTERESNGHLVSSANKLKVHLRVADIPIFDGVVDCIEAGIFSTLHPQNIRCARAIENVEFGKEFPHYPVIFDPQTSGGLLAAVPKEAVEEVLLRLKEAGYSRSSVIGEVYNKVSEHVDSQAFDEDMPVTLL